MAALDAKLLEGGHVESILIGMGITKIAYQSRDNQQYNLIFHRSYVTYEHSAINLDIKQITVQNESRLLDQVYHEIETGVGEKTEGLQHFSFVEAWQGRPVVEIVAQRMEIVQCGSAADKSSALYDIREGEYVGGDFPPDFA